MTIKVYVEGGGDHNKALQTECRKGFSEFFQKSGLGGRMPRVVACGGRRRAYDNFRTSHENRQNELPILLVDSESPIVADSPWEHVRASPEDQWEQPDGASNDQIHFMVVTMEAWFHADKETLRVYYGAAFRTASLSQRTDVEAIAKPDLFDGLNRATRDCQKGEYSKGEDSFRILARIDPLKVKMSSRYAERLLAVLDQVCST